MRSDDQILRVVEDTPPRNRRLCPQYGQNCGCMGCLFLTREEFARWRDLVLADAD